MKKDIQKQTERERKKRGKTLIEKEKERGKEGERKNTERERVKESIERDWYKEKNRKKEGKRGRISEKVINNTQNDRVR